jgi:hypothetical protein
MFLLPFIFSFWAAISFLLLFQALLSRRTAVWIITFLHGILSQAFQWFGFLCWLFPSSYTGHFWLGLLRWLFIVPITFFPFFHYVYNFGPKHCKRSLFDILRNPVPGIEFDGCIGESDDFDSLQRRQFNHNLIARRIARNKQLSAKRTTRSSTAIIHDVLMAHICHTAPILSGYQTYATFHDTSMENAVIDSRSSMPMTLYFAICNFLCPEIVFASLPQRPPDGILTKFIVSTSLDSFLV